MDFENFEELAMESTEVLFNYPEVAMEWGKGADPTKYMHVATPYIKRPFANSYMPEMKKYYSSMVKKLMPIALDVARNEQGIARVERIDMNKIIEYLEDTDYNYMATKMPDMKVDTYTSVNYNMNTQSHDFQTFNDITQFREYVRIRKSKGEAVLSVDIANVYYQKVIFNKPTEINRRLSDAFNSATHNQYKDEVFLTSHFAGSDDGRSKDKIALQLNFIIKKKYYA